MPPLLVGVVLDSAPTHAYHVATLAAIEHAAAALSTSVDIQMMPSDTLGDGAQAESTSAIVIGPGAPYRDLEAVLATIRTARERGIPLVGT